MIFNASPVLDICDLVEEWGLFVTVRQKRHPRFLVEWSSNDWDVFIQHRVQTRYFIHPDIPITYLGIHDRNHTVAEFQLGVWGVRPGEGTEAFKLLVDLMVRLRGYRPNNVANPNFNEHFFYRGFTEKPAETGDTNYAGLSSGGDTRRAGKYLSGPRRAMRGRHRGMRYPMGRGGHSSLP